MSKVFKIGITENNNKKVQEVNLIELVANKGIVGDRYFNDFSDPLSQLTLIESENIDYYNTKYNSKIDYLDFRRNIITKAEANWFGLSYLFLFFTTARIAK